MLDPNEVTLFRHPLVTLSTLLKLIFELILSLLSLLKNKLVVVPVIAITVLFVMVPPARQISWFCVWWVLMGVASSVGLGTGLHTFVLYLLPHVASVITARAKCNGTVPEMLPHRYNFEYFGECPTQQTPSLLGILWAIEFEAVLWGAGSAIGELPPYFIAREAALGRQKIVGSSIQPIDEEGDGLSQLQKQEGQETSKEMKELIIISLKNYGFVTILILASIPNPFFDLAGLACGHFGIPLITFFSATFIGKSFIKVHLQILMVLFLLSQQFLDAVLNTVDQYFPKLHQQITSSVQSHKERMFDKIPGQESLVMVVWNVAITVMIMYFVVSIVNTLVQRRLAQQKVEGATT